MTELTADAIRTVGPADAVPDGFAGTTIMCQGHGSEFDVTTGAAVSGPAARPLNVYEVPVADGSLRIRA
jgi:nitrite reductase/ring-hydroxylating ferredoxin subunit